jgi:type IV pilus assembly protein PilW
MNEQTRTMSPKSRASMRGMSIVEILAAMLIGLIGMTIIMQVYSLSEARKRTTTGTGDAQIAGNIAMFMLERELRPAGFGLVTSNSTLLGCSLPIHDDDRGAIAAVTGLTPNLTMGPVIIEAGGANPDRIAIAYGNSWSAVDGAEFATAPTAAGPLGVKNSAGFQVGDVVVIQEGTNCALAEVTGFDVASSNNILHEAATPYSFTRTNDANQIVTVNRTSRYNDNASLGFAFTVNAKLFSLGRDPVVRQYRIEDDKLVTRSLFPYDATQDANNDGWSESELSEGIVNLKAQYGIDANDDGVIEGAEWNTTTPTTEAQWKQLLAVRVGLLARSGQYEKEQVTPNAPEWFGGAFPMANPADGTDWRNYRYRVYQTVVPLRNIIWSNE